MIDLQSLMMLLIAVMSTNTGLIMYALKRIDKHEKCTVQIRVALMQKFPDLRDILRDS